MARHSVASFFLRYDLLFPEISLFLQYLKSSFCVYLFGLEALASSEARVFFLAPAPKKKPLLARQEGLFQPRKG
jgi:hypothetical protein